MMRFVRQAGHLFPDRGGVGVLGEDGDQQAVLRQAVVFGDEVPRIRDGVVLKVVAEAEIAKHFKKGVVAGGVANVVEVIVLPPRPHAFLRRRRSAVGTFLLPGEDVLELHHAGVGEHQGGVVARHERRACHRRVPVAGEIVQEGGADVVAAGHDGWSGFPIVRLIKGIT